MSENKSKQNVAVDETKRLSGEERAVQLSKLKRLELARLLVELSEENDKLKAELAELQTQNKDIKALGEKVEKVLGALEDKES